jgi:hypothetical protein
VDVPTSAAEHYGRTLERRPAGSDLNFAQDAL